MLSFFYLPYSTGVMRYLPEEPHIFSLAEVQAEHASRLTEPEKVLDFAGDKTTDSLLARFKCYDVYEQYDFSLSRLAIEALKHPDLRAQVLVQYGTENLLKCPPG